MLGGVGAWISQKKKVRLELGFIGGSLAPRVAAWWQKRTAGEKHFNGGVQKFTPQLCELMCGLCAVQEVQKLIFHISMNLFHRAGK